MNASAHMDDRPSCLIIACGALAKEIVLLRNQLGVSGENIELQCLPAGYHNTPAKIAPAVEAILKEKRSDYDNVLIGYGECGTGSALDNVLARYDAQRLPHAHCYEFFAGFSTFHEIVEDEIGSFFLTDYLVKNFDRLVITGLGLDRFPHLRDAYFSNYRNVVYLAQTDDPELLVRARQAADRLGLQLIHKKVGYGDLLHAVNAAATGATPQYEPGHVFG